MLFNSLQFLLLFLPVVLLVAFRLRGQALLVWITLTSFVFYAFAGHVWFLLPMLFTTALDFFLARVLENARRPGVRRAILGISLCGNLGLLGYFKYSGLLLHSFLPGLDPAYSRFFDVILPAGISFYTFQTLSYMIDVYRKKCGAERSFFKFASFVSFFPHLIAGPLTRHDQLIPQLGRIARDGVRPRWREGVFLFSVGLIKKVLIADRIANLIDPALVDLRAIGFATAWLSLLGYALQIYFDFSGYSDMAIGLGRLFGIELPQNFNRPYRALNPSEFWRRWHITLSLWLRDYLYIPLGGNRGSENRKHVNLVITMVLGGLWHGANWTFAIWGLWHGLLLVVYHRTAHWWDRWPKVMQGIVTFFLVCAGWVFFRAPTLGDAVLWLEGLAGLNDLGPKRLAGADLKLAALVGVGLAVTQFLPNASRFEGFVSMKWHRQFALAVLTLSALLLMNYSSKFLYFQF